MFRRVLSIMLCLLLLFCSGCNGQAATGISKPQGSAEGSGGKEWSARDDAEGTAESTPAAPIVYESCDTVYILNEIPTDEKARVTLRYENGEIVLQQLYFKNGYYISEDNVKQETKVFDLDGNYLRDVEPIEAGTQDAIGTYWFTQNGEPYYLDVRLDDIQMCFRLSLYTEDGTLVRENFMPCQTVMEHEFILNEQYYMLVYMQNLYIYDTQLRLIAENRLQQEIIDVIMLSEREALLVCDGGFSYLFDFMKNSITPKIIYENTEEASKATDFLYTEDAIYILCNEGIFVQREGIQTLLCDFERSYLSLAEMTFLDVLPDDRFLIKYQDQFLGKTYYAILEPTKEAQRPVREKVRIAVIGYTLDPLNDSSMIENAISYFNRNNETYCAELTDYDYLSAFRDDGSMMLTEGYSDRRNSLFTQDLLDGKIYDVYLFGGAFSDFKDIEDKSVLLDLSDLADRLDIMPGIKNAMQRDAVTGDAIYTIPFSVTLKTLLTTTDTLSDGEAFTFDRLIEIFGTLGEGEALFASDTRNNLKTVLLQDHFDKQTGTSTFDSDAFIRAMTFLSDWDNADTRVDTRLPLNTPYLNTTVGSIIGGYGDVYFNGDIIEAFANGVVRFLEFTVSHPNNIPILFSLGEKLGVEWNLCGYPSSAGGSIYMEPNLRISRGNGTNSAGADAFIKMMFSDTVQSACDGFPVIRSAVESHFSWGMQYYEEYSTRSGDSNFSSAYLIHFLDSSTFALETEPDFTTHSVKVLKSDFDRVVSYFCDGNTRTDGDAVVRNIIDEELSAAAGGVRSIADAAKIIQSRVFIYINE